MRQTYTLTLEDYLFLTEKIKEPAIPVNSNNLAWIELGKKYKFDPWTIEPISYYQFTAESTENANR